MPIDYKDYHPKWKLISRLIRFKRAKNRCEWCGRKSGQIIDRETGKYPSHLKWTRFHRLLYNHHSGFSYSSLLKHFGFTKIVLTVAHIDQCKSNNRFSNLAALCQRYHLNHDRKHHIQKRIYGNNKNQIVIFQDIK